MPKTLSDHRRADAILDEMNAEDMADAQLVTGDPRPGTAGTSVRLSIPLLRILDIMAKEQHRTRSNLIQHILWDFVRSRRRHPV